MASQTQPTPATPLSWPATRLSWIGRQLLLVPEAVLLLTLLCLHATLGPSPALVALGMGMVLWFATRVGLLYAAKRSVDSGRYGRAEVMAKIAGRLYPLSADAHALLGTVYLRQGDPGASALALTRAVRYYPFQAELHAALSAALLAGGRAHDALMSATTALMIDPGCAPAYLSQASAEDLLDAPPELIERHLRAGLEQRAAPADEAALRCALAHVLVRRGDADEARRALASAERLLPKSQLAQRAELHYQIGEILRIIGDSDAARAHFRASESLDPDGPCAADAWRAARS
ncbi:tetratricopeptide repeat protein [Oscillochloris sp. ZM17-4]|uniref:tetratricopeptide repeat protein n=1 Tax=Oscillochloris sp. ZM17-4 TaxID=2866714 RepID=UPI001C736A5E|nr:tetratricopeptide repeat protein [Oscillochloris sp. ZM17-4]MBX0327796.1 tetratricopeptide repeat protein [Oscillochloris sp. ZM17-4]